MWWLLSIDLACFRWINQTLSNPACDLLMPLFSDSKLILLPALVAVPFMLWLGNARLRACLLFAIAAVVLGESLVIGPLKQAIRRPRPADLLPETRLLVGQGKPRSMPSGHAANSFTVVAVMVWFYRRKALVLLPVAGAIAISRVYNGAHFPSDVLVGAILGTACAGLTIWGADRLWAGLGRRWWPLWHQRLPSLKHPQPRPPPESPPPADLDLQAHWLRLGYVLIAILLVARWGYLASDRIELSEDEAYQWVWSKHLDLSYYSKPPMIAYTQFLGTALWGDTGFGVRFFSPLIGATVSLLMLHFFARNAQARLGFWLLGMASTTPLLAAGSTLMTIDPLSVLFWTAALVAGWQAIHQDRLAPWIWCGLWLGLGLLSKYVALLQWLSFAVFFILWPPARRQLRRPGPYVALALSLLFFLPILIWNIQHDWIGLTHLGERGGLDRAWQPTLRYFGEFIGAEIGLLNPVYFLGLLGALIGILKQTERRPLSLYLFSMGAPLLLLCLLFSLRSRVHPNWIAPAVIPLLALTVIYWTDRFRQGATFVKPWFATGVALGAIAVFLLHETDNVRSLTGLSLPVKWDPLRRVRGWESAVRNVGSARDSLLAEGKPVFIIADHYGIAGLISFYLPEARTAVASEPFVYCLTADRPKNQFHLWPGYELRQGQNALFVREGERPKPTPARLRDQFHSVTPLPVIEVRQQGKTLHYLHLYECRGLR
ncbi:MAG: glycosyltransferase family 39 protein [Verrucomicrobia bacterium]|nr:glycosyltransferase family 39 protein [Verrucomicrobiota bacterium]